MKHDGHLCSFSSAGDAGSSSLAPTSVVGGATGCQVFGCYVLKMVGGSEERE